MSRLAIVWDLGTIAILDALEAAAGVCDLVWVVGHDELAPPMGRLLDRSGTVVERDQHEEDLAAALRKLGVDGITCFAEASMPLASHLAVRLDLRYHGPRTAELLADKLHQGMALAATGLPMPPTVWLPDVPVAEREAVIAGLRFPVVLKPRSGLGARETVRVDGPAKLGAVLAAAPEPLLIAEYLPGRGTEAAIADDVAVEAFVRDGTLTFFAVTGKFRLAYPFRSRGTFVPAALSQGEAAGAFTAAAAAVKALGIGDGFVNVDLKLTPDGPRVIEVNGRIGGRVAETVALAGGPRLLPIAVKAAIGVLTEDDMNELRDWRPEGIGYCALVQAPKDAKQFLAATGFDEVAALDHVRSVARNAPADGLIHWRAGLSSNVGVVSGWVEDHRMLVAARAEIDRRLRIEFEDAAGVRRVSQPDDGS